MHPALGREVDGASNSERRFYAARFFRAGTHSPPILLSISHAAAERGTGLGTKLVVVHEFIALVAGFGSGVGTAPSKVGNPSPC